MLKATSATSCGFTQRAPRALCSADGEKRIGVGTKGLQLLANLYLRLLRKSGACPACVEELSVLVVAKQERAEAIAALGGQGEAADDKLLPQAAFHFHPACAAAGEIHAVGALGDDAFRAVTAGFLEDRCLLIAYMLTDPDGVVVQCFDELREQILPFGEGESAQPMSVEMQEIEDVVVQRVLRALLEGGLQSGEAADAILVEDDHFAIEQRGLCG